MEGDEDRSACLRENISTGIVRDEENVDFIGRSVHGTLRLGELEMEDAYYDSVLLATADLSFSYWKPFRMQG